MPKELRLSVRNFGPIRRADVGFGDITVLVGPQATGKSLILQWLKLIVDRNRVAAALSEHGFEINGDMGRLLGLFFGSGYRHAWRSHTAIRFASKRYLAGELARSKRVSGPDGVLYVPAHRALVMTTGWPLIFRGFRADTPFVVRDFSERTGQYLAQSEAQAVFPIKGRYRDEIRQALDESLFHGGKVEVETMGLGEKALRLVHGDTQLSVMEWTTGQREALPLIVGLYDALPAGGVDRRASLNWVVVEEPELGLHPDAIIAVFVLLMEVVRRGYRLVVSTHSPLFLDLMWALRQLQDEGQSLGAKKLLRILGLSPTAFAKKLARSALRRSQRIVYTNFEDGAVVSQDITGLDPFSEDAAVSGWGGLIAHNTRIADVITGGL